MKSKLLLLIMVLIIPPFIVMGQKQESKKEKTPEKKSMDDDERTENEPIVHWNFGVNIGGYFAGNYSANFYNGSPQNVNNINYVLSNYYWYQDIYRDLNANDKVILSGIPTDMNYAFTMMGGLFLRYNFDRKNGIFIDANYCQLKTEDAITLEVDPNPYSLEPEDLRYCPVVGREYRVNIDLAYQRSFPLKSRISPFIQCGMVMNYTRVLQSFVVIADKEYNMINIYGSQYYIPNTSLQEYSMIQGGFGFGLMAGGGVSFPLTDAFGVEPGAFVHYYNVNLEGYNKYQPSLGIYLRIMFGNAAQ
jgi:hypothetical protein